MDSVHQLMAKLGEARQSSWGSSRELMTNLRILLSLATIGGASLAGCLPDGPSKGDAPVDMAQTVDSQASLSGHQLFNQQVLPLLTATCGACHSREVGVGPGFLRSASPDPTIYDPYPIVTNWTNFIVPDPELSALLTKGQHEGPSLTIDQYNTTLAWLLQEKKERDAVSVIPFSPQVPPQAVTLTTNLASPIYNKIDLGRIDQSFVGAYFQFIATSLSSNGDGLEMSDLRVVNIKPNPQPGEQRSIHFRNPLFVLWRGGVPYPDPDSSFSGTDRTIALNQNDPGKTGVLMIPGILVLDKFRSDYSLSVVFDVIELVKPVIGSNPCTANQLTYFTNNVGPYLGAKMAGNAVSCAKSACHSPPTNTAQLDMSPALTTGSDLTALCEQLKFYNGLNILSQNTDPNASYNHPYKWSTTECSNASFPPTCFTDFQSKLDTWRQTQ